MPDAIRIGHITVGQGTAARIRAAMLGSTGEGIRVVRQAWRVTDTDSDETALLALTDGSWWVAQRLADHLSVWAFAGDIEADAGFDRLIADGGWREAGDTPLAG